ncbi:MAG: ATP-binding cassette domain-containing protein [Coprococcus sp.]
MLHDLNFAIHAGEKIAIVGVNGAGKTTLSKLLAGLLVVTEGKMKVFSLIHLLLCFRNISNMH